MSVYRRGDPRSDTPEPVRDEPSPKRGGRRRKLEPSTADPFGYYAFSDPTAAMAASAIIGPPGAHAVNGIAGLGTGVSN
jgi:hypothetical protein